MKKKHLTLAFFLVSLSIFSQNWIEVGKDKFGNEYYIKSSIVSKGGDFGNKDSIIKIWTKQTSKSFTDNRNKKKKVYYNIYLIQLFEFDCSNSSAKLLSRTFYTSKGGVIMGNDIEPYSTNWEVVVPDSMGEAILNKVCELYN